jgi:transposase
MSLKPTVIQPVPEETARVARAAFRKGNPLLQLRDELGTIFSDEGFADLFPRLGQPGLPPWRLALVTLLQFREDLPDRQAAEAVRARIAWKYLLGLELADPGFDHSVLGEFRSRLLEGRAEERLLGKRYWTPAEPGACSRRAAGSAPTPPMCSRPSGCSTASSCWARPCARR